jgi:MFS family permease
LHAESFSWAGSDRDFFFSVFLTPLAQEFHTGRAAVSLAISLYSVAVACSLPFAGRLIDRLGARKVILFSTFAVGLILLSARFCSGKIWRLARMGGRLVLVGTYRRRKSELFGPFGEDGRFEA